MWLFALIVIWSLGEIALFVAIGGALGVGLTLLWVLASAVLGVALLRHQASRGARLQLDELRHPVRLLADGALAGVGAVLLILPGFLTDGIGLLLLVPPIRSAIIALTAARIEARFGPMPRQPGGPDTDEFGPQDWGRGPRPTARPGQTIDGEFIELPDDGTPPPRRRPSGWTQH